MDPHASASVCTAQVKAARAALESALSWSLNSGRDVPGVLSQADLARLIRVLRRQEPFDILDYGKLAFLAQLVWRGAGKLLPLARFGLADVLNVLSDLRGGVTSEAWCFERHPDSRVLHDLGYVRDINGLEHQHSLHRWGWEAHGDECKAFTVAAVDRCARFERVVVLGAARVLDVPVDHLADRFKSVVLVDIDPAALLQTQQSLLARHKANVQVLPLDVTGVASGFYARVNEIFATNQTATDVCEATAALLLSYRGAVISGLQNAVGSADLVISQMILSQLNALLERYPRTLFSQRYGRDPLRESLAWVESSKLFAHLLQHDHITAVKQLAPLAVITSDVAEVPTRINSSGEIEPTGDERLLLGAYRLEERLAIGSEVVQGDEWYWHRVLPTRASTTGSTMRVQALTLRQI